MASWPFPLTPEHQRRENDPRLSVAERYPTKEVYIASLHEAAERIERERILLAEDADRILETAASMPWETTGVE